MLIIELYCIYSTMQLRFVVNIFSTGLPKRTNCTPMTNILKVSPVLGLLRNYRNLYNFPGIFEVLILSQRRQSLRYIVEEFPKFPSSGYALALTRLIPKVLLRTYYQASNSALAQYIGKMLHGLFLLTFVSIPRIRRVRLNLRWV
jgi:hypothetical protein